VKRILIADDEPYIVTALEFLLKNNGYEVQVARNGDEALALMASAPPDLVLLDVMMPLRSGYDVCRQIRRQTELRAIKVVMLSAKGGQADVQKGLEAGADLYITKPFSNRELLDKISALLSEEKPPR
jgi:two-component system, OmpR family, alkaline phosphatase synthesis response regulator PhoP